MRSTLAIKPCIVFFRFFTVLSERQRQLERSYRGLKSDCACRCPASSSIKCPRFGQAEAMVFGLQGGGQGLRICENPMYRIALIAALPILISSAHAETGLASYYGGRGHGMTCAHRTRPFGSVVTVSYRGHSIRCRVNDRGPFVRGRVIDLSLNAARALGMMRAGIIRVSVE